jgi:hypothetical protein
VSCRQAYKWLERKAKVSQTTGHTHLYLLLCDANDLRLGSEQPDTEQSQHTYTE